MLQSLQHLHHPSLDTLQYVHVSFAELRAGASTSGVSLQCFVKKKDRLLWYADNSLPILAQEALKLSFLHRHIAGSCSPWCPPGTPGSFLQSHFPAGQQCRRLFLLSCRTLRFALLNHTRFLPDHFSSLLKCLHWIPCDLYFHRPSSHCLQSFHQHFN